MRHLEAVSLAISVGCLFSPGDAVWHLTTAQTRNQPWSTTAHLLTVPSFLVARPVNLDKMQFGECLVNVHRTYFIFQGQHNLKSYAISFYILFYKLLAKTALYSTYSTI
jgi:hypothetical protein